MSKVSLRAYRSGRAVSRLTCWLVIAGLVLGFAVVAGAQNPTDTPKPKVVIVKPGDKKPDTPSPGDTPKPAPKTPVTPSKPVNTNDPIGFTTYDEPTILINDYLTKAWKDNNITPSDRCSDHEFIRRVSLDIIGRIATVAEIEKFMKDPQASRREKLLERLLYGELKAEYASNWATLWTHALMTRTGPPLYRRQIHLWLEDLFSEDVQNHKSMVEQLIAAKGKTNGGADGKEGAVNYILAHLGGPNPAGRQGQEGAFDVVPVTSRSIRLFLGYQIQCTQCHDHPFNADWKQKHFWGVNTFFRQVERVGQLQMQNNNMMMQNQVLELRDNPGYNQKGIVFYEKRNGVFLPSEPIFLDGRRIPAGGQLTRREQLANFVTSHKNFNMAAVNRMWGHLFGRGMNVKPGYDDFGEHNEVVHPELLAKLGEQWAGSGAHDPRKLIKWICSSEAYNLKSIANTSNIATEAEPYFARMQLKMLTPEELLESLITATKSGGGGDNADVKEAQKNLRNQWMAVLVRNFGDDEGNEVSYNGTILQALLMMNGRDLNAAIATTGTGTVKEAMKFKTGKQTMDFLFLATLNRPASQKEYSQVVSRLPLAGGRIKDDGAGPLQDLFWALLNCNEFILNH
jgi:hypothetical protein